MKPLILASQSPRRREILGYFGLPFEVISPHFDEAPHDGTTPSRDYVLDLAKGKALSVSIQHPESVVIGADTVVVRDETIFGKPRDRADAHRMLRALSGRWHEVMTAICVAEGAEHYGDVATTRVRFHELTDSQIELYLDQIRWDDKAGAYAVQEAGSVIINGIEGCYHCVMGLSISVLERLLQEVEIDLWKHLLAKPQ